MKNILITGGTGYIGSHLVDEIVKNRSLKIFMVNRTFQESLPNSITQIVHCFEDHVDKLHEKIPTDQIDVIIHLAGVAHGKTSKKDGSEFNFNYSSTRDLIYIAHRLKVKKFIFLSSIAVYKSTQEIDEDTPMKPSTNYGRSKLRAEEILKEACSEGNLKIVVLRPPLVYGPNAPGNILKLEKLIKVFHLLPFGQFNNKRSFIHLNKLVLLIIRLALSKKNNSGFYNVADPEISSTSELINWMINNVWHKGKNISFPPKVLLFFCKIIRLEKLFRKLYEPLSIKNNDYERLYKNIKN